MTERLTLADLTARLQGGLIVSCQPVPGGPFDTVDAVAAYARVAEAGGAVGLRVEGVRNVEGAVGASRLPVVGLIMGLYYWIKAESPDKVATGKLWFFGALALSVVYSLLSSAQQY